MIFNGWSTLNNVLVVLDDTEALQQKMIYKKLAPLVHWVYWKWQLFATFPKCKIQKCIRFRDVKRKQEILSMNQIKSQSWPWAPSNMKIWMLHCPLGGDNPCAGRKKKGKVQVKSETKRKKKWKYRLKKKIERHARWKVIVRMWSKVRVCYWQKN